MDRHPDGLEHLAAVSFALAAHSPALSIFFDHRLGKGLKGSFATTRQ
jgi:hypothetical protein